MFDAPESAGKYDIFTIARPVARPRIIQSLVLTKCKDRQEFRKRKYSVFTNLRTTATS